jgi:sodium-dependent dicarboxylate transporter 2/3/5
MVNFIGGGTNPLMLLVRNYRYLVICLVWLIFGVLISITPPHGLSPQGMKALAIFFVCVVFWVTNVIPLMITSLLAIILFPLLGVLDGKLTYSLFGNQAVFFILGAFILASALMRSGLSTRLALLILKKFGRSPRSLMLSILLLPAFASFWMSAHAVAAMMFPLVSEIVDALELKSPGDNYGKSLFLAMAWGCIIGGITTFLGGARAPLALGILFEITGKSIGFVPWALASLPTVLIMLLLTYIVLCELFPYKLDDVSPAKKMLSKKVAALKKISVQEKALGVLMLVTVCCWVFWGQFMGLANIALAAVIVAFTFNLLHWKEVEEDVNWGIFLMYGGAICLGFAMEKTGAAKWLAENILGNSFKTPWGLVLPLSFISLFLTEAISNSAVVALLMPIAISISAQFKLDPVIATMVLTIPSGLAFVLPMGTPATAIAFSSGFVKTIDTVKAGLLLKIIAWIIFNLLAYFYWPLLGFKI